MRPMASSKRAHNLPVDSDAQLRMLPAVAPVGRRSPSRCTGTAAPLPPQGMLRSPGLRFLEARRSVWWCGPRLVDAPRTAAAFICVGAQRRSLASWPNEAEHTFGAAANAVGARSSQTSMLVRRPPIEAVAGRVARSRCGLRACERHSREVQPRARYNRSVDSDAQLRMLPAVAPVGRRSPLRCTGTAAPLSPESMLRSPGVRPLEVRRYVWWSSPRLMDTPRTAAESICVGVRRRSLASWPKEAVHSSGAAVDAVGSRLSQTSMPLWEPSKEAVAGAVGRSRCGLRACERRSQEIQPRARYNRSVDSDAQLRMLPAVAPVGRRSPSR